MKRRLALAVMAGAAISACTPAAQAQAQAKPQDDIPPTLGPVLLMARPVPQSPPAAPQSLLFMDDRFDVTGAGVLELGDLDEVLGPFGSDFGDGREGLPFELTVDAGGAVIGCTVQGAPRLEQAGEALCSHAMANGRFRQSPGLMLDYTQATYRLTVRYSSDRAASGRRAFYTNTGFPYQGVAVLFGLFDLPPEEERMAVADVRLAGMEYPLAALREGLEGRVEVLLTFNPGGRVATCRPIRSTQTARLAYETCFEVRRIARLINPPDTRTLFLATRWMLPD